MFRIRPICRRPLGAALALALLSPLAVVAGNGSDADTFTYQGQLRESGQPATGLYDFEVCLYDSPTDPSQLACLSPGAEDIPVEDGMFTLDLNFGPGWFDGQPRYLELRVRPGDSVGGFTQLLPRQRLRPTPLAMHAYRTPWAGLVDMPAGFADGVDNEGVTQVGSGFGLSGGPITSTGSLAVNTSAVQARVGTACAVGSAIRAIAQDGSVTCQDPPLAWLLGGNAGTNSSSHYIGTSDDQPLNLRSNNRRLARFQSVELPAPATLRTANIILGHSLNDVRTGVRGATIAGGGATGDDPDFVSEQPNGVNDHYGTVSGGYGNFAGDSATALATTSFASVGGGLQNVARGAHSTIGGGRYNRTQGGDATTVGGFNNLSSGTASTALGGSFNSATGANSVTVGGSQLCAGGQYSVAAGRRAKVRPGLNSGAAGNACFGIEVTGADGDVGTFAWADSQTGDFTSTGSNQFLIRAQGGVGIGTNAPQNQLHVVESIDAVGNAENHVVQFENPSAGGSPDVLALKVGTTNPGAGVNYISFLHGGASSAGSIEGNGAGGVVFAGPGNDFAEYLPKRDLAETIKPGDVLGLHAGALSRQTAGADLILVASRSPIIVGNDPGADRRSDFVLAALLGQVEVEVQGTVAAGDLLLPSGRDDGLARAVPVESVLNPEQRRQVFARVLTVERAGEGSSTVRALVGLGADAVAEAHALSRLERENAALRVELAQLRQEQQQAVAALRQVVDELRQQPRTLQASLQP
jgi:hypothetical protein